MTLTLAHLSDVHLALAPRIGFRHVNLKRGLGLINWHRNRKSVHRLAVVESLLADLARHQPDHIAVTGDLVNFGLPEEHREALRWLGTLGSPATVSVVPGNHDIYTRLHADPGTGRWHAYMTSDAWGSTLTSAWEGFPYVRRVGPVALIGLNSAVPTPPFVAAGRLGEAQLKRLAGLLREIGTVGLARVILIHHPPLPGQASRMRGLADCAALQDVLATEGADLVLHGHNHRDMEARVHRAGAIALGVPSFSAGITHGKEPLGRYNLIHFHAREGRLDIELIGRGLESPDGGVIELERRWLVGQPHNSSIAPMQRTDSTADRNMQ